MLQACFAKDVCLLSSNVSLWNVRMTHIVDARESAVKIIVQIAAIWAVPSNASELTQIMDAHKSTAAF